MLSLNSHSLLSALVLAAVLLLLAFPAAAVDFDDGQSELVEALYESPQQTTVSPASACRGGVRVRWRMRNTPNILCQGLIPSRIFSNGERTTIVNQLPNRRGVATYQCRNGSWSGVSGSCAAVGGATCPAGAHVSWGPATGGCGGRTHKIGQQGETIRVVNYGVMRGGANVRCLNGRWVVQQGWTCTAANCGPQRVHWGAGRVSGCQGDLRQTLRLQQSTSVSHNVRYAQNRRGFVTVRCTLAGLVYDRKSCVETSTPPPPPTTYCPEQRSITWGNCVNMPHNILRTPNYLIRSPHGTTKRIIHLTRYNNRVHGNINYKCEHGTWRITSQTCNI